ncbi:helix-turn-helix domain-containing protein [Bradyrhizobium elkanii]|uniref:helix-turn-helix domain-containing protein n=1 Tax=Bradyrhizobium elkanii TaxID=29448 RepID=UPI001BA66A54|nr:helix-turn-helix domain-containing protein [Bradyrhizobium elkanii]MBR1165208.1 helix-turn-helix domain-containing protein [Bradyrhizobium elkanii]
MAATGSLILSDEEQAELIALAVRIVLACAGGSQNKELAAQLGVIETTVGEWRRRFAQNRVEGLRDEARPGAPSDDQ